MPPRKTYPRPPIVEAVIDFRFDSGISGPSIVDALASRLQEQYRGERKTQEQLEFTAKLGQQSLATSARRVSVVTFLQSATGSRLLGAGDGRLSVHVLAPYPGWETFLEQAKEAVESVPPELGRTPLSMIAVRYIDRITLPATALVFDEYVTVMPPRLAGMPAQLAGFHMSTQTTEPSDGTEATLTIASAPPEPGALPAFIYDLTLRRRGAALGNLEGSSWVATVEDLHQRQIDVFEASITDRARELFQ